MEIRLDYKKSRPRVTGHWIFDNEAEIQARFLSGISVKSNVIQVALRPIKVT